MEKLSSIKIKYLFALSCFIFTITTYSQNISVTKRVSFNNLYEISFGEQSDIDIAPLESKPEREYRYALIISNENYKKVPEVPYSLNDGRIIYKYFNKIFRIPERNIVHIENATYNDMKYAIKNIEMKCQKFPDKLEFYIYYSGHGIPEEKTGESFLLPIDGIGTDPSSGYSLKELYEQINSFKTKSIYLFIDACFSGTRRDGGMLLATRGITIKPKSEVPSGNLLVFSATSGEETAFPIEEHKHGLFTYSLLSALKDTEENITWGDFTDLIIRNVIDSSINLTGKIQTPTVMVAPELSGSWRSQKIKN